MPTMVIGKTIAFLLSNLGWWELLRRRAKLDPAFLPGAAIAVQVSLLFVAGILNFVTYTLLGIYGLGFLSLAWWVYRDRSFAFGKHYCIPAFAYLALAFTAMAWFLYGRKFDSFDDFTHWALVVKEMLATNRFPSFMDPVVNFPSYPLGSSSYIYYFSRMVSRKEWGQMLAQTYMMLAAVLPVFSFCRKNGLAALVLGLFATNFLFVYNDAVTSLMVDTLLPLVSASGLLYLWQYCRHPKEEPERLWIGAAYLLQMIQTKNSGVLFVAAGVIVLLADGWKDRELRSRLPGILIPFGSLFVWQRHCRYVFWDAGVSNHSMTLKNFMVVLREKDGQSIRQIVTGVIRFVPTFRDNWILVGALLVLGALAIQLRKENRSSIKHVLTGCLLLFGAYEVGLLMMYLFTMPVHEAVRLASITRYSKTMLIFLFYVELCLTMAVLSDWNRENLIPGLCAMCVVIVCAMAVEQKPQLVFSNQQNPNSTRMWLEGLVYEYDVPPGESYCLLMKRNHDGIQEFIGQYFFNTMQVRYILNATDADLADITEDYVLIEDTENPAVAEYIRREYPDQAGNRVISRNGETTSY